MKRTLLFLLLSFCIHRMQATHIVGGEIMYKYLNSNGVDATYRVTLFLYIDCINGQQGAIDIDKEGFINIFSINKTLDGYTYDQYRKELGPGMFLDYQLVNSMSGPVRVSDVNYQCIKNKPDACVDKYTYTINITVPVNTEGYIISFERCCRNHTINNIIDPDNSGATYWTKIPGIRQIAVDNSPVFKSLPPNFLCTNAPLKFDHSATDADGDSLVYELYTPYLGATSLDPLPNALGCTNPSAFRQILWNGYSENMQIDGNPTLSIDSKTGKLSLTPTFEGQFVIGIKVVEYRNGVRIGETKRDFQFNVTACIFSVVSSFFVPKFNCTGNQVSFNNRSENGIHYRWDFGVKPLVDDTSVFTNPVYTYASPGDYTVRLITSNSVCTDTFDYDITVKKNFKVHLPADTLLCGPFSYKIIPDVLNKTAYQWNSGQITPTITVNKGGQYIVSVTDAPCVSRDTMNIINDLSVIDLGPDSVICRDSFVQFTWGGIPGYKTYLWNDSTQLQSIFISHLGKYWVNVTNKNNCPSVDSITFVLYPPPRVNMNDTLFCKGTSVLLDGVNYSSKTNLETHYLWTTGETTSRITVFNPGLYAVKVRNKLCTILDTAVLKFIETGLELGPDTFYCGPVDRWLRPLHTYARYQWFDNAEVIDYHATTPGKKKLTITSQEGCIESDSVTLSQFPSIDGGLGHDTTICLSSKMTLTASDSMTDYLWNTGETTRSIVISDSGVYVVTVKNKNGCVVKDSVRISEQQNALPVDLFMPNAFSPNNDNLNEFYPGNKYADPGSPYLLRLYNRWGEKIFEGHKPSEQWDGTYKGDMAPQDVYVFYVKYVGCDEVERWFRGTFTLMR